MAKIDTYLMAMKDNDASDLHMQVGIPARFRIHGQLIEIAGFEEELTYKTIQGLMDELLSKEQIQRFRQCEELDFSVGLESCGRFRCNYFQDYWGPAVAFRRIPVDIPGLAELSLPEAIDSFAHLRNGLCLITGATGSGKSSTLAAVIDKINRTYTKHIITLEDPIEYIHPNKRSVVHQRGMIEDFTDFTSGLRGAIRANPDVLLVGELRDLESIRLALGAAEMGMLVFATLHTIGAAPSIDRIYNVFPADEQSEIRTMVSQSLQGVVSQVLLKTVDGKGRVPATELFVCSPAVRNLIREGKTQEINNFMQSGKSQGMHTLVDTLERLVREGRIKPDDALAYSGRSDRLERLIAQTA